MALSENASKIITFLQENPTVELTAKELADKLDLKTAQVNGTALSLGNKGLVTREKVLDENDKEISVIKLTDAGKAFKE